MADYLNKMQLALRDKALRAAVKTGAAVAILVGAAFFLAAFWTWIASYLGLGAMYASLIVGGIFTAVGLGVWLFASSVRYPVPTRDDLRREVSDRIDLVADIVAEKVKARTEAAVGNAQSRVASFFDAAGAGLGETGESAANLTEQVTRTAKQARETLDHVSQTRAGPLIGLAGAFAVGVFVARGLHHRPRRHEYYDDYDDDDYR